MELIQTSLMGCFLIKPKLFVDSRGLFLEAFNSQTFNQATGRFVEFVQDNLSVSTYGVIRGLHFQKGESSQAKLVSVIQGSVLDVAVDLRENSPTFRKHVAYVLDDVSRLQLFVPRGFAHGFSVLSEKAVLSYKCDNYYDKKQEGGIRFDDPALSIDWRIPKHRMIVSDKDKELPCLNEINQRIDLLNN